MIVTPTAIVDGRDQDALLGTMNSRRPGYVPEWTPGPGDAGQAIELIAARYGQAMLQRLNQALDKNRLAFLSMLGERLAPAKAARVPIVFQLANDVPSAVAPAGTAVSAPPPPGSSQQVAFETESTLGITAGKLAQVFSLWPSRDEYIDHSADVAAGQPITLFNRQTLVTAPHELYLSHPILLNLSGNVVLNIDVQLAQVGSDALEIAWEYWDGQVWRGFAPLDPGCDPRPAAAGDATNGLTASGIIRLTADCASSDKTAVNGLNGYWIRGRLTQPLAPDPAKVLPGVESIRIRSLVSQTLVGQLSGTAQQPQVVFSAREAQLSSVATAVAPALLTGVVTNEAGLGIRGATVVITNPTQVAFGQRTVVTDYHGYFEVVLDDLGSARVLRFEVLFFGAGAAANIEVPPRTANVQLMLKLAALTLAKAYNDGTKLDTTKPFYPFGQQPQPGTVFYFANAEVFSKPGALFRLYLPCTSASSESLKPTDTDTADSSVNKLTHLVIWEYWDGSAWTELPKVGAQTVLADFTTSEILDFRVPLDIAAVEVNDDPDFWMRARLVNGGYGFVQTMTFLTGAAGTATNTFSVLVTQPPILAGAALAYSWIFGPFAPEAVLAFNDFGYADYTYEATWPGSTFRPFQTIEDVTPTVYLGFNAKPPNADIGVFFDIVERPAGAAAAPFVWEYWDGGRWSDMAVEDGTAQLTSSGILSLTVGQDSTALARFGTALHWLRGRLKEDGLPPEIVMSAIYPNAVWALQQQSFTDVAIGKATGQPGEVFRIAQAPVIPIEQLEVLELSGGRANVEWRLVALALFGSDQGRIRKLEELLGKEVLAGDIVDGDLRLRRDRNKLVSEVWVRWQPQPSLFFSSATDRHYAIDRTRGLVFFGDGINGRTLPQDTAVVIRQFRSGGGSGGNVAARSVTQLLGTIAGVQAVFNPRPAEGGSDGETLGAFARRAPAAVRHAGRALTTGDYEAMVREASAAVAVVKALANRNAAGRPMPGWITIVIIPESQDPRPYPTRGLRDEVLAYLVARAPAGLAAGGRIIVTGPTYFPVDIAASVVPVNESDAALVEARARQALAAFLHPLHGGPSRDGWDCGRSVYLSDVAAVLEAVEGLDFADTIQLLVNGDLRDGVAEVPRDQIVTAGMIRLNVKGARR